MKRWRAKRVLLRLTRKRDIQITVRRFRTQTVYRSRRYRQFVFDSLGIAGVYEVSFSMRTYRRPRRQKHLAYTLPKLRIITPYALLLIGIVGVSWYGHALAIGNQLEPVKTFSVSHESTAPHSTSPAIPSLPASVPTHIQIPAVNIDAPIMTVSKAPDGSIQMPPILDWTTGWYKYSPTPGQIGPSIIVGHVDTYKSISVFWRLRYLQPGNDIYIQRADGSTVHFKVIALTQVSQANFPTAQVYRNISYPGLRLITCGGTFSTATESYNQNTVVYAAMVL